MLALLIKLAPSMQIVVGLDALSHRSWFQDLANNFLSDDNMCLGWNYIADLHIPPIIISDYAYIRFIGDRSIQEKGL